MAQQPKRAIQRIVTDDSGNIRLIYVDLETLQPVDDLSNYKVINANQQNIEQVQDISDPDPEPLNPTSLADRGLDAQTQSLSSVSNSDRISPVSSESSRATVVGGGSTNLSPVNSQSQTVSPTRTTSEVARSSSGRETTNSAQAGRNTNTVNSTNNNQAAGFVNDFAKAEHRKGTPDQGFINSVTDIAGRTLGPGTTVTGYSGQGQYGSARHRDERGIAMDATISNSNHTIGKQAMEDVAMAYAAAHPNAGIGYDKNYMGVQNIHLDQFAQPGDIGKSWGAKDPRTNSFSRSMMDQNFAKNLDFARATGIGPTPTFGAPTPFGPNDPQSPATATGDEIDTNTIAGLSASSIASMNARNSGIDPTVTSTKGVTTVDDGYTSTTRAGIGGWRNNNPGNLRNTEYSQNKGSIGQDYRGFAVFGTLDQGVKAMNDLLFSSPKYQGLTIDQALNRYAPPEDDNNTKGYINTITQALGVSADTKLSDLSPSQRDTMLSTMMGFESGPNNVRETSSMHTYSGAPNTGNMDAPSESRRGGNFSSDPGGGGITSKGGSFGQSYSSGFGPDLGRFGSGADMTSAVSAANGESQGGRGRGGFAASSNTGASDKGTSSYGGAKSSGDAQSSGKSGSTGGNKSSGSSGGRAGGVGTAGVGGGFSSTDKSGGRTSGKTDEN